LRSRLDQAGDPMPDTAKFHFPEWLVPQPILIAAAVVLQW
jgi:hypothetical protein